MNGIVFPPCKTTSTEFSSSWSQ